MKRIPAMRNIFSDIHPKGISQPSASLMKLEVLAVHHQVDGAPMRSANITMIVVMRLREMKTRMRIVMEGADGIVLPQPHSQCVCHLFDRQLSQFFYIIRFYFHHDKYLFIDKIKQPYFCTF